MIVQNTIKKDLLDESLELMTDEELETLFIQVNEEANYNLIIRIEDILNKRDSKYKGILAYSPPKIGQKRRIVLDGKEACPIYRGIKVTYIPIVDKSIPLEHGTKPLNRTCKCHDCCESAYGSMPQ